MHPKKEQKTPNFQYALIKGTMAYRWPGTPFSEKRDNLELLIPQTLLGAEEDEGQTEEGDLEGDEGEEEPEEVGLAWPPKKIFKDS